jgi:hypothetical protein
MIVSGLLMASCLLAFIGCVVSRAIGHGRTEPTYRLWAYGMATVCYYMAVGLFCISLAVALLHRLGVIDGGSLSSIF